MGADGTDDLTAKLYGTVRYAIAGVKAMQSDLVQHEKALKGLIRRLERSKAREGQASKWLAVARSSRQAQAAKTAGVQRLLRGDELCAECRVKIIQTMVLGDSKEATWAVQILGEDDGGSR